MFAMPQLPEPPETRIAILRAAQRLLDRYGPERVRMSDVAREAGFSRQAVYLHFGSRAGLLVALVEHVDRTAGIEARVAAVLAAPDGPEMLRRFIHFHAEFNPHVHAAGNAIAHARHRDPDAAAAWESRTQGRLAGCRELVRRLVAEGRLAAGWTAEEAADLAWALTALDTWHALVMERGWTSAQYEQHLHRVLRSALLA